MNAHPLGVAHPAGGLLGLRQLAVHRLLSRQNPGVAAGHVRREDLTRQGVKDHRRIGIHRGVAQAFFAEVGDDVSVVVNQCQHSRRRGGVDPRVQLQVADHAVSFRTHFGPGQVQLRLLQRITVFLQGDVALIVALAALDQQVLDLRVQRRDRLLAGLPGGSHLIEVGLRDVLHRTQALVAIERDLIVTRGVLRGAQVGAGGGDLRVQLLVAQFRLLEGDLRRFNFINEWRWVELIQQVALFHLAVVVHVDVRDIAGDPRRNRGHHAHDGGVRRQRDPDIGNDKPGEYSQKSGNTHPYPAGKFLFRRHHSVLDLVIFFADIPQTAGDLI